MVGLLIVNIAWVIWSNWQKKREKKTNDEKVDVAKKENDKEVEIAKNKVLHGEADATAQEIIKYYKEKIEILEEQQRESEQKHQENEVRISALEKVVSNQKDYITTLVELVTGSDPSTTSYRKMVIDTLGENAPRIKETHETVIKIHQHLKGGEKHE